ncbi:glucosaminidase domain-containing protein [Hutsoniella sourekii]
MACPVTAQQVLTKARSYLGLQAGSSGHRQLVASYNQVQPRPAGYAVQISDTWCDLFVTVVADQVGLSPWIGRECGVQRHIQIFKQKGIWLGRKTRPQAGDIICFDWDGGGFADHIGWVEAWASDQDVWTLEGNSRNQVARNRFNWQDRRIMGYARPPYRLDHAGKKATPHSTINPPVSPDLVNQVIQGLWGNGQDRVRRLQEAGYSASQVQAAVNTRLLGNRRPSQAAEGRGKPTASSQTPASLPATASNQTSASSQPAADPTNASVTSNPAQAPNKATASASKAGSLIQPSPTSQPIETTNQASTNHNETATSSKAPTSSTANPSKANVTQDLTLNGHTLPRDKIQAIQQAGLKQGILPSLILCLFYLESHWGHSKLAQLDNNWAGITWSSSYRGHPEVPKTPGSPRPQSEGGVYVHYASFQDFLQDWVHLLRPHHLYRVAGVNDFDLAVRGLFQVGGAKYDYAASGYTAYSKSMRSIRRQLDRLYPGHLDQLDQALTQKAGFTPHPTSLSVGQTVTLHPDTQTWANGWAMPAFVKGRRYQIAQTRPDSSLIQYLDTIMGWVDNEWLVLG